VHAVKEGNIGATAGADGHAFALGQANIVTPLALHRFEQRLRAGGQIDDDRIAKLYLLRRKAPAALGQQIERGLTSRLDSLVWPRFAKDAGDVGVYFDEERLSLAGVGFQVGQNLAG